MKAVLLGFVCVLCAIGMTLGQYGGYGSYGYGYGRSRGGGSGLGFLGLIGLLVILLVIFGQNRKETIVVAANLSKG